MKTTLHTIILQVLKRGQLTPADRLNISRFIPVSKYFVFIQNDDDETVQKFTDLTIDRQREIIQDVRTPDTNPPQQLNREDKILFLGILKNGMTPQNIEKLSRFGIQNDCSLFNIDGKFLLMTPKQIYTTLFGEDKP